ncbi:6,7-dimethyl-8-ribityllumazine synthase [Thioalkalivibrio sp. HK1]|uniref:6,7-dimethyl-8-ribityllumazine synthase n=1 Tax=Thioalkalivibrio sp. HK1 TaxID=1469245 RepID=UPI0004B55188|nr:6,7-dimethyl-8-ribityllumazine synthase [Thioalkalivibrio sp. HK1]
MAHHDLDQAELRIADTLDIEGAAFGIVASRYNEAIVSSMLESALETLHRHRAMPGIEIPVVRVPGAFELPLAARRLAIARNLQAVIALGAVIRGDTPHFDHVCTQSAHGILTLSLELDIPIAFGVLTCDTQEQAMARADRAGQDKGREAALVALEMVSLCRGLDIDHRGMKVSR